MRKISLIALAYKHAGMVFAVMVMTLGINLWVIQRHIHQTSVAQGEQALIQYAQNISQQLQFYQSVLKQLARQSEMHDILIMDDPVAAQEWAKKQQSYLPHNIGLALTGVEGRVLGTPVEMRLGPSCVSDLRKKFSHHSQPEPLVHRDNPRLAHFDLTEPVTDSLGQDVGILFVSFSLDSLQAVLAHSVLPQQTLVLRDGKGQVIAQAGATPDDGKILHHEIGVPSSAWRLELTHAKVDTTPIYLALGGANLATSVLIIATFATVIVTMVRLFTRELDRIKTLLNEVHAGKPITMAESLLKETEQILPVIQTIAGNIRDKQAKLVTLSLTDELTQLPNRRHFNMELERACNLSQRGVQVGLLLIDVDRFKQINDSAGHAAGDKVLQLLAACLRHDTRKTDFTARLGGDEFAVVLTNMQKDHLTAWVQRLAADFQAALGYEPLTATAPVCTFSAGAVFAECAATRDPAELFRRADHALYRAKEKGRNCLEVDQAETSSAPAGDQTLRGEQN